VSRDEATARALQVPGASLNAACLGIGDVWLVLVEYVEPADGKPFSLTNADVGAIHVAFWVDDLIDVYQRLMARASRLPPSQPCCRTVMHLRVTASRTFVILMGFNSSSSSRQPRLR
jgi:hypothetical protein